MRLEAFYFLKVYFNVEVLNLMVIAVLLRKLIFTKRGKNNQEKSCDEIES